MVTYGLPSRGQRDWDDEVNNSVEYLHSQAQAATAAAEQARSNATQAITIAQDAVARAQGALGVVLALDTDGVPYLTGHVPSDSVVQIDSDSIPYVNIGV